MRVFFMDKSNRGEHSQLLAAIRGGKDLTYIINLMQSVDINNQNIEDGYTTPCM